MQDFLRSAKLTIDEIERLKIKTEKAMKAAEKLRDSTSPFPTSDVPKVIFSQLMKINRETARKMWNFNVATFQRNMMSSRLEVLNQKMQDGRFHGNKIAIARFEGQNFIMNGQHTLWLIMEMGYEIECWVQVFQCKTQKQMSCCFAQFDDGGNRTPKQIGRCYADSKGEAWVQADGSLDLLSIAAAHVRFGPAYRGRVKSVEARIELVDDFLLEAEAIRDILFPDGKKTRFMARGPVAIAMLYTFIADAEEAKKFWTSVRDGIGFNSGNQPERVLRDYLMSVTQSNVNAKAGKVKEGNDTITGKCLVAWNLYRNGLPVPRKGTNSDSYDLKFKGKRLPKAA